MPNQTLVYLNRGNEQNNQKRRKTAMICLEACICLFTHAKPWFGLELCINEVSVKVVFLF